MDPRGWNGEMDLTISVGLGLGNKAEQIGQAETVLAAMERLAATPYGWLVRPEHVRAGVARLFNAAGIRNVDDYLGDPGQAPSPTGRDPDEIRLEAEAQLRAAELAGRQQEAAARLQLAREESAARIALAREESRAKLLAAREKAALEMQLAREKMAIEAGLERERASAPAASDTMPESRPGGDLDK
jgi:hypothetical protein